VAFERILVRTKRDINGILVDGIISERTNVEVRVTQNPVESGVDISDHIITVPSTIILEGVVSDTPLGIAAFTNTINNIGGAVDQVSGYFGASEPKGQTRSQQYYTQLVELLKKHEFITLQTKLKRYEFLVFQSIVVEQDKDTSRAVFFTANFHEVIVVDSAQPTAINNENINEPDQANAYSEYNNNGDWELSEAGLNITNKLAQGGQ